MTDFGGKLRQARERRGISLRQIAASTKISVAALEALERNDISKLPGGIFSRSFVRSYAAEVGLDPDETVREFLERFHAEPVSTAPVASQIPEEELEFERRKQMAAKVFIAAVVAMLVLSGVIGYFVLKMWKRPDQPAQPSPTVSAPAPPASSAPTSGSGAPVAQTPAAAPATTPMPAGTHRLDLHPTGNCWISAVVDGEKVLSRVVEAGEKTSFTFKSSAVLTVGDAGAFAFSIDGKPGKSLGAVGEVKTAKLTPQTIAEYTR